MYFDFLKIDNTNVFDFLLYYTHFYLCFVYIYNMEKCKKIKKMNDTKQNKKTNEIKFERNLYNIIIT